MIFVFPSNLAGRHTSEYAKKAVAEYGAKEGKSEGMAGNSYAIPTMGHTMKVLPLSDIDHSIRRFLRFSDMHPELMFCISDIGCGEEGYTPEKISPMFKDVPSNCILHPRLMETMK